MDDDEGYDSFNDDDFDDADDDAFGDDGDDDVDFSDGGGGGLDPIDAAAAAAAASDEAKKEYVVIPTSGIEKTVEQNVESVASTLGIPNSTTAILLRHLNWNKDKLIEQYFASPEQMYTKVGLPETPVDASSSAPPKQNTSKSEEEVECGICVEDVPFSDTAALACDHRFCSSCWHDYLTDRIATASTDCVKSTCPEYKCKMPVPDEFFHRFVPESEWQKFRLFVVKSFVAGQHDMRWCPNAGCDNAVKSLMTPLYTVNCECGYKFCFSCYQEGHDPVSCENLEEWLSKCKNDSETAHWIIANTKRCPECNVRIEKSHGCNHMTCQSCKYEFCWICMGNWKDHGTQTGGFYKCNRYRARKEADAKNDTSKLDAKNEAKVDLDKYLFYYQRYHNHDQSRKFAKRQREAVEQRMASLRASGNTSWADVQYLAEANKQIMECRQILKYTYAFGYYLPDGPEKELFEFLQQDLEKNTEFLHELSEQKDVAKIDRSAVINYTAITKKFAEALLSGISRGLTH